MTKVLIVEDSAIRRVLRQAELEVEATLEAGANDYVTTPFTPDSISAAPGKFVG